MVNELERGEDCKPSPLFPGEMEQYDVQNINFRALKKDPSIAAIATIEVTFFTQ
jgi:hypothetical protein